MKFEIISRTDRVNDLRARLMEKESEFENSPLYREIQELKLAVKKAEEDMVSEEQRAISQMLSVGITEITLNGVKYSVRNTAREKVVIEDENLIPKEYMRVKLEVDKKAIMALYKECGVLVEGIDIQKEDSFKLNIKEVK